MQNDDLKGKEDNKINDFFAQQLVAAFFVAIFFGIYMLFIFLCNKAKIQEAERRQLGIGLLVILFVTFYIIGIIIT